VSEKKPRASSTTVSAPGS